MYIKCDTVDQLEEVMKYYNNIESYISAVNMFKWYDYKEPICISENGDFGRLSYFKSLNVDIITFSQWQIQTLRDLGFDTELANDMLSRIDKDKQKENSMSPIFQIRITNADKTNWYKDRELYIVTEEGDYYKYEDKYINKTHCEVLYPIAKEIARLYNKGLNTSTIAEKLNVDLEYVDSLIDGAYRGFAEYIFYMVKEYNLSQVEDKKVFTINETNEIQYNEYKIKSTVNTFLKRAIRILKNDELIVELINPTPDKLRSEFAYYGIDVAVE